MPLPTPESLGLPSKPAAPEVSAPFSQPSASGPSASTHPAGPPASDPAGPSSAADPSKCAHCDSPPKYTCPRCSVRTCSLPCAKLHKSSTSCSGIRDPAAFVPLNKITQGTWDSDYAWLEERRRQIASWGESITADEAARVGVTPRGRGGKVMQPRQKKSKLDGLRWAIGEIGADVDILPDGMGRRKTNQSSWNPKNRALNLTIQFEVPPHDDDPTLISHPRVHLLPQRDTPQTLRTLLPDRLRDDPNLVFLLSYHLPRWRERQRERNGETTSAVGGRKFFPPLDGDKPLHEVFRGTAFVEFPTVIVLSRESWDKLKGEVTIMPLFENKRKAETQGGSEQGGSEKKAKIEGLQALGDYGSEDEASEGIGAEAEEEAEGEEGGDVELSPEMAAALGNALVADFGG